MTNWYTESLGFCCYLKSHYFYFCLIKPVLYLVFLHNFMQGELFAT